ncbi:MAG: 30S processome protein Utp24 [Candidatus Bathyarchaeota archaeon]|nr:30S processome protein Utp24 [Candidatus Bathyarchaeota archaeon]
MDVSIKVILDSNFLLLPFQFGIDIFECVRDLLCRNVEFIVLPQIVEEVKRIADGVGDNSRGARLALKLIEEKCTILDLDEVRGLNTDESILRAAVNLDAVVATNDRTLRRKLRSKGIPTIFLRERSHLDIDGYIP